MDRHVLPRALFEQLRRELLHASWEEPCWVTAKENLSTGKRAPLSGYPIPWPNTYLTHTEHLFIGVSGGAEDRPEY